MKYKLAIFDMDGTILNTLEDLTDSLNYSLKQSIFPERTIDEVRQFVGNGIRKLIERGVPKEASQLQVDRVYADFSEYYKQHCSDKTTPYNGINELLEKLRKNGIKTAVVSNKADFAVQDLCKQYFNGLFDLAVGEKSGVRKKPYPDSVNAVLKELEVDRKNSVYIGDSEVDIQTAANSDMDCISVDWGFRDRSLLKEKGAELIISDVSDLEKYIIG